MCVQHEAAEREGDEAEGGPRPDLPPDPHRGPAQHQLGQHDG